MAKTPKETDTLAEQTDAANLEKTGNDKPEGEQTDEANLEKTGNAPPRQDNGCTPTVDEFGNKSWPAPGVARF